MLKNASKMRQHIVKKTSKILEKTLQEFFKKASNMLQK